MINMDTRIGELEIEITADCNKGCYDCNHFCALYQAASKEEMSPHQLEKFFSQFVGGKEYMINAVGLLGGEPTLHTQLDKIIEITDKYSKIIDFKWGIITNRITQKSIDIEKNILATTSAVEIGGGTDPGKFQPYFRPINIAPIDIGVYDGESDCGWDCGFAFNKYGIYPCSPALAIDRALGLDIGLKNVSDINEENFNSILDKVCMYCCFYSVKDIMPYKWNAYKNGNTKPLVTKFWSDAFEKYKIKKPKLTLF